MKVQDVEAELAGMTDEELQHIDQLVWDDINELIWTPLPGPQTLAYESVADVVGYGGAAGGGKTDLACGAALTKHIKTAIFRRESTQLTGIMDRLTEILGSRDGYNGRENVWRGAGPRKVQIEFGSCPNVGDETKHQGRPKDLLVIDEAANFLEHQVRFLMGWVRTTVAGQKCQTLMTFNPPTSSEGRWVIDFFGPWLDDRHPMYPTPPGELRWVAVVDGKDIWLEEPKDYHHEGEVIKPQSRTFIPSKIGDNPFLANTGYMATLQSLPEPLRSQMLLGDFKAGMEDDAFQVIPTGWVDAAMDRWVDYQPKPEMDMVGVDVARGGKDNTVIARRHGMWFDRPMLHPGKSTPDGPTVAGLAMAAVRDHAPIQIDVIGVGASPYDFLNEAGQDVYGVNVSEAAQGLDVSGRLRFANLRSELVWRMREALDPAANTGIALPPDQRLRGDLCAYTWKLRGDKVQVESREEIEKRIGRSPDWASAYILALIEAPKRKRMFERSHAPRGEYNPIEHAGTHIGQRHEHNPYE